MILTFSVVFVVIIIAIIVIVVVFSSFVALIFENDGDSLLYVSVVIANFPLLSYCALLFY